MRVALLLLVLSFGCSDQRDFVLDSDSLEDSIQPGAGRFFARGTGEVGEPCDTLLDCFSLDCQGPQDQGLCNQACSVASCPDGTTCTSVGFGVSCEFDEDCFVLPECDGRTCFCDATDGGLECVTDDFCAEICTRGGGDECRSDDAICEAHPFLSLDVCIPVVFFSGG